MGDPCHSSNIKFQSISAAVRRARAAPPGPSWPSAACARLGREPLASQSHETEGHMQQGLNGGEAVLVKVVVAAADLHLRSSDSLESLRADHIPETGCLANGPPSFEANPWHAIRVDTCRLHVLQIGLIQLHDCMLLRPAETCPAAARGCRACGSQSHLVAAGLRNPQAVSFLQATIHCMLRLDVDRTLEVADAKLAPRAILETGAKEDEKYRHSRHLGPTPAGYSPRSSSGPPTTVTTARTSSHDSLSHLAEPDQAGQPQHRRKREL